MPSVHAKCTLQILPPMYSRPITLQVGLAQCFLWDSRGHYGLFWALEGLLSCLSGIVSEPRALGSSLPLYSCQCCLVTLEGLNGLYQCPYLAIFGPYRFRDLKRILGQAIGKVSNPMYLAFVDPSDLSSHVLRQVDLLFGWVRIHGG